MKLYGIDINPLKSNEFIVNGDDEYIRMYDKRNLSMGPIKQFQYEINNCTRSEKVIILYRCYVTHLNQINQYFWKKCKPFLTGW